MNFGRHVGLRSQLFGYQGVGWGREAKITELQLIFFVNQQILRFDIPVNNIFAVQIIECFRKLANVLR